MMKKPVWFLLTIVLVTGVGVSAQMGPGETQPQAKAGEKAQEKSVVKKYPPYPDVWGYELPWPGKDDRVSRPNIFKMSDGDYFVTYVKSRKSSERKDGTCCEFKHTFAGLSFFSGSHRDLTGKELNAFGEKNSENRVKADSISFSDGSRIERRIFNHCVTFPYSILKVNQAGQVVMNRTLFYVPETPKRRNITLCEGMGSQDVEEKVEAPIFTFVPLEDETFLLYEPEGNHIIRFDKDLNSKFVANSRVVLLDTEIVERFMKSKDVHQARIDAVFQYVQGLKERGDK